MGHGHGPTYTPIDLGYMGVGLENIPFQHVQRLLFYPIQPPSINDRPTIISHNNFKQNLFPNFSGPCKYFYVTKELRRVSIKLQKTKAYISLTTKTCGRPIGPTGVSFSFVIN